MTKRQAAALASAGLAVGMGALWGGSYFIHPLAYSDWQAFPATMTCVLIAVGAIVMLGVGLANLLK